LGCEASIPELKKKLIKNSLQVIIREEYCSEDQNLLLLDTVAKGSRVILGSVYGPNSNDPPFFEKLSEKLWQYNGVPVILSGDWNCTYSSSPLENNIDCLNMARLPNLNHSLLLNEMCDSFNLGDPFRFLYPEKLDFSYVPRVENSKNKSRLDFFIMSEDFMEKMAECVILPGLQNKLFDHKAVTLTLNKHTAPIISNP
jgi:exonuclease III